MAIRWIICASLGEFLCAKLKISFKTQENISKLAVCSERRQIFQNLNGRFSLNFPDSYMAIRWIICASLGEFRASFMGRFRVRLFKNRCKNRN